MIDLKNGLTANLKVWKKKEVVVVGGGTAGVVAALAARKNGADTLLIERESYLGGMMTGGLVLALNAMRSDAPDRQCVIKGIFVKEIFKRLVEAGGTNPPDEKGEPRHNGQQHLDPWILSHVLDEMMEEYNIEVLYDTFAFDAVVEDNVVKGVAIANKSGAQVVLADVVVDASADADIAAAAGAPYVVGRKKDGRTFGGALLMVVGGIDPLKFIDWLKNMPPMTDEERAKFEEERIRLLGYGSHFNWEKEGHPPVHAFRRKRKTWEEIEKEIKEGTFGLEGGVMLPDTTRLVMEWIKYIKEGRVPPLLGSPKLIYPTPMWGFFSQWRAGKIRTDQMVTGLFECWFDQTNAEQLSKAISYMRRVNGIIFKFLKERIPGFENAYILVEAPNVDTRESRRIVGEYTLTEEDAFNERRFPDVIGKCGAGLYIKRPFDVPYRILVPKKIDNLLVAGRCVSIDEGIFGHGFRFVFRGEGNCIMTGEAAGTAAALSVRLGVPPRKLDVKLLQKTLLQQGALLFLDDEKEREQEVLSYSPAS